MAQIDFGGRRFAADLVVFDKDGTLIDFEIMWGRLAESWGRLLEEMLADESLRPDLFATLGYDPQARRTRPQSPLAIATTGQLQVITASVLYRHGVRWAEALGKVRGVFERAAELLPLAETVQPAGNVAGLLASLQGAGVRVAVITTDHRAETEETLRLLGVAQWVDHLVCGDDGLPVKPEPDTLLATFQALEVEPRRAAMVGDTLADLWLARNAGAGLAAAVLTGADDADTLAPHADVVLRSIDGIRVAGL